MAQREVEAFGPLLTELRRTLGASMDLEDGAAEALARLESAQLSWAHEEPREVVALSLSSVTLPPQTDDATRAFIALWRAQLTIDAQLSVGEVQCALETLGEWIADEGARAPVEIARRVRAQRALWLMACGQLDEAAEALEALIAEGGEALPALLDALVGLRLSRGELMEAQALAMSAAAIHAQATDDPGAMLRALHESLQEELESTEMYMSLFYAVLDLHAGQLVYANAGHAQAFRSLPNGESVRLLATNPPLGITDLDAYGEESTDWSSRDDLLLLFTDGLSDALDLGEIRGQQRVLDEVRTFRTRPVTEILEHLYALPTGDNAPVDDRTAVLVRF